LKLDKGLSTMANLSKVISTSSDHPKVTLEVKKGQIT
jgi:hypothetical protein